MSGRSTCAGLRARQQFQLPGGVAHMRGVSLIEVLVSVLVLGIGLLGVAAMQSLALRGGQSSLETSQAVMQTNAILEAMRANRANADDYNGTWATPPGVTSLATSDLNEWIAGMQGSAEWQSGLDAAAMVSSTAQATVAGCPAACVITIQWDDSRGGGSNARQLVTETRI